MDNRTKRYFTICFWMAMLISLSLFLFPQEVSAISYSKSLTESISLSSSTSFNSPKFFIGSPTASFGTGDGQASDFANSLTQTPILITYDDNTNPAWQDGQNHTLQITISSAKTGSSVTLTLVEVSSSCFDINCPPTVNTGFFKNNNLFFMNGNNQIPVGRTLTVTITDPAANSDSSVIDTLSVSTFTNSSYAISDNGITRLFNETGINTGVFSGKISTTSGPSSGSAVHAEPGDVLTVRDNPSAVVSNSIITPNPRSDVAGLYVVSGDTITATFGGLTTTADITAQSNEPGGGGGGLVISPGLVLDVLAAIGGSGSVAPSFSLTNLALVPNADIPANIKNEILNQDPNTPISPDRTTQFDFPLVIDGGGYPLAGYSNKIVTVAEKTNTPVDLKLNIPETNLQHLALYTNLHGTDNDLTKSDTYIIYDKDQPLQIVDPHHYFDHVKFDMTTTKGIFNKIDYTITFANPMDKSNIIFRTWNDRRSSSDVVIQNAWQVTEGPKLTSSSQLSPSQEQNIPIPQTPTLVPPVASQETPDIVSKIKDWGGYSPNPISDAQLLDSLGLKGNHIPSWVMKNTKWIVQDELSENEFLSVVQYLSEKGIIK